MQVFHFRQMPDLTAEKRKQTVAYVKKQVRNPLAGILYTGNISGGTDLSEEHRQSLQKCQLQLNKVLDDRDIERVRRVFSLNLLFHSPFKFYFSHHKTSVPLLQVCKPKNVRVHTP